MSEKKKTLISCEWKKKKSSLHNENNPPSPPFSKGGLGGFSDKKKTFKENKSRFYKHKGSFMWQGIKTERYKPTGRDWADIIRQTLIGSRGETTKFHLRYFEIAPGGYSSFEMHKHEHVVIGVRGKGTCIVNKKTYKIGFLDTLYIQPDAPHQLRNPFNEPFGFFCIVNARRDKPKILRP
ncbi:MAG: cupin domain-containing protein [Nitrospirota bacterium]